MTGRPVLCGGPGLTAADRDLIGRARTLARLGGNGFRAHTRERDPVLALASALGEAQHLLRTLADLAERASGEG